MFDNIAFVESPSLNRYLNEINPKVVPTRPQGRVPAIARLVLDAAGSDEMWPCTALRWTDEAVMVTIQFTPGESQSARPLWLAVDDVARVLRQAIPSAPQPPEAQRSTG